MPARPLNDGVFTPRQFPLDPFDAEGSDSSVPWSLDASALPSDDLLSFQKNVILVLGEPPLDAIAPLLHSPHLASSLLIIATARVYTFPPITTPAVRVLRLGVSLVSSNSAASRLVAVLQWADRIACTWRTHASPAAFQELSEDGPAAGYLTPPNRTSWFGTVPNSSSSALPSPASSDLALSLKLTPPRASSVSRASTKRTSIIHSDSPCRDLAHRAFDALFNFLPPDAPDRHLLKHAILVTTVARPFLTSTSPSHSAPKPPAHPKRRFSLRTRPAIAAPPTPTLSPTPTPAHVAHLVPPARAALIRPLESFCLSFSFPSASSRSAPALGLPPGIDIGAPGPAPRPYLMPPTALGDVLHAGERSWTLAELVLCGALDGELVERSERERGKVSLRSLARRERAWLNGTGDLVLEGRARALSEQQEPRRATVLPYVMPANGTQSYGWYEGHAHPAPNRRSTSAPLTPHVSTSSHSSSDRTLQVSSPSSPTSPQWPTPSSSASSSPSSSPELDVKPDAKGGTGMLSLPWDKHSRGSGSVSGSVKKRKGLFRWIKR